MNKLYGLIGHPVGHSMSPLMHNDAFRQLGINGHYHAFDVREEKLSEAVNAMRVLNVTGFNVTIPHKVAIMNYLDEIDEEAKMIGAVNTVVNIEGHLIGYNTDGRGYLTSLLRLLKKPLKDSNILVIGAGGAARAVVIAMATHGVAELTITNRTREKAVMIQNHCKKIRQDINVIPLDNAKKIADKYDIIINTTSIGMSPNIDAIPFPIENIKQKAILSDLIYNPLKTKWLELGEKKGLTIHNGVGMFVEQGVLAFQKWTNQKPNSERMTEVVIEKLGGSTC